MERNLIELWGENGRAVGMMVFEFFSPGMPSIAEAAGADFLLYDMEHTGMGYETLKQQVAGCRGLSVCPMVRVPAHDYTYIARALDVGAHGIMVPMVETADQARAAAAAMRYPPVGVRGAAFGIAHDAYQPGSPAEKIKAANHRATLITLIETKEGLANVEEIAAIDGVDILWLGHFDLTNSMGIPGQFDHPDYLAAVDRIVTAAKSNGKPAGFMAGDITWASAYWEKGFSVLAYGLDHMLLQSALSEGIKEIREYNVNGRGA